MYDDGNLVSIEFEKACQQGNLALVKSIPENGDHWNNGLFHGCYGGHLKIVDFMIEKGASNWNGGLYGACQGGHLKMVQLMVDRGANQFNFGLYGASQGGHLEIVKFMIKCGANNYNDGLHYSCAHGRLQIADFFIDKGADNLSDGLYYASINEKFKLAQLMIEKGAKFTYLTIDRVYWLLENGICIDRFGTTAFKELMYEIKMFRKNIRASRHFLIPDLLNLVSEYSLK